MDKILSKFNVGFINTLLIKRADKNRRSDLQSDFWQEEFAKIEKTAKKYVYMVEMKAPSLGRVNNEYAALNYVAQLKYGDKNYCEDNCKNNNKEQSLPYYVLTYDVNNKIRNYINVARGVVGLKEYINNGKIERSKEYYQVATSILTNIKKAVNDKIIIGYTFDSGLAESYAAFKYYEGMPIEEVEDAWENLDKDDYVNKMKVLYIVTGNKWEKVHSEIQSRVLIAPIPFQDFYWELATQMMKGSQKCDVFVGKFILDSNEVQDIFISSGTLEGLDFGKADQFNILKLAMDAGVNYEELMAEDRWLNIEEMHQKAKELGLI